MSKLLSLEKKIMEYITDIYIFVIFLIFPLIVDKTGFFHILEIKWDSYFYISLGYLAINILVILFFLIFKKTNIFKEIKFNKIHILLLVFLLINILSAFFSPYIDEVNFFKGIGRGEGLINVCLYTLSFLSVTLFGKFKKKYILYPSILSILLNTIALLQYVGFNPFNMYQDGIGTHNVSFMTTIGNVDFISALYCLLIPSSLCAFITLKNNKFENIIHLLSISLGFLILSIIDVQSGKVGIILTLIIFLPIFISNNKRLSKSLIALSSVLIVNAINVFINPEYHYDLGSINFYYQVNYIVIGLLVCAIVLLVLARFVYKEEYEIKNKKKLLKVYYITCLSFILVGLISIYFINFSSRILHEIHEILHGNFDDSFGTYRVFLWKRTIKLIPEYPLIGSGPDTFALRFMSKYTEDIMAIGPLTINDTAANVYLTMVINIGIIGLMSYLSLLGVIIKKCIKKINKYSMVFFISLICFLIQDFFNLSVVIITPIFWLVLAINVLAVKKEE